MNALTPYLTRSVRPLGQAFRRRLGFSAIEVTAVAAVIAVLALILVPVVNKRVDESKIVAAQDDMMGIEKAETLAFGYTGHYYRLCDLDRPAPDKNDPLAGRKVPPAWWNRPITQQEQASLKTSWTGPYMQMHRSITMEELVQNFPNLVHVYDNMPGGGSGTVGGGPIMLTENENDWANPNPASPTWPDKGDSDVLKRRNYPVDPWGNPYLFFGPGMIDAEHNGDKTALKTGGKTPYNWPNAVVYSLGPDGLPGTAAATAIGDGYYYLREAETGSPTTPPAPPITNLGTGDDLKREF